MAHIWATRGRELLNTVSVLGDAEPKRNDTAITEQRVEGRDAEVLCFHTPG
jgi:hypothetical protein